MTNLYHSTRPEDDAGAFLLPETRGLLDCLSDTTWEDLEAPDRQDSRRVATYRARPEPNAPLLKFRVEDADQNLLRFVGQDAVGLEVLQVHCAGFQYHWRSDLSRVFEEQVPLLSRVYGLSSTRELAIDHLVVPLIRKHRVREIRGWFIFSQDVDGATTWVGDTVATLFRRTEPARPVRLPTRLWDPERKRIRPAGLFRAAGRGWRDAKEPRRS